MTYPIPQTPAKCGSIIDTHVHYDDTRFDEYRNELLNSFYELGVSKVINCGCCVESSLKCIELAKKHTCAYAAVGFHPGNVKGDIDLEKIGELLLEKRVVAIGEIGLDYYWDQSFKDAQKKAFSMQLELALQNNLPVIIHDREAHADTMEILKAYKPEGVMHCFSGSVETAHELVKMGMYIGVGGVLTFKNSKKLKEVVAATPIEHILLETDAPYLAPEPFRGKTNNSSLILYTAECLADIKGIKTDEVLSITAANAERLFQFEKF